MEQPLRQVYDQAGITEREITIENVHLVRSTNALEISCALVAPLPEERLRSFKAAMKGLLAPTFKEVLQGHIEVRQTIRVPGVGIIAGSYVQDGKVTRNSQIRVVRDGIVVMEDHITSLRRFKDDVREVAAGYECGIGLEKSTDIQIGDILEAFIMEEVAR